MSNTRIWDQVCETDPGTTKPVNDGRRSFTCVDAYAQIQRATELWGPYGSAWGLIDIKVEMWGEQLVKMEALFMYPGEALTETMSFPIINTIKHSTNAGKVDADHLKKLQTDTLTKALSLLGFNVDIYLGKFDDNRYVQAMREKHAAKQKPLTLLQQVHKLGKAAYADWQSECGELCRDVTKETTPDKIRTSSKELTDPELKEVLARINTDKQAREQAE